MNAKIQEKEAPPLFPILRIANMLRFMQGYYLSILTGHIGDMVRCGALRPEGLDAASLDAPTARLRRVLSDLSEEMATGATLSEALATQPDSFPAYYVEMVRCGEEADDLTQTFNELESYVAQVAEFRDELRNELGYVVWILTLQLFIFAGLFTFVIPQFVQIFSFFGQQLPFVTRFIQGYGRTLCLTVACSLPLGALFWWYYANNARFLPFLRPLTNKIPVALSHFPIAGGIFTRRHLARAAWIWSRLEARGIPTCRILGILSGLDLPRKLRSAFARVAERLEAGTDLRDAFDGEANALPASFRGLAALGASGGRLSEALDDIARLYRREALRNARIMRDMFLPCMVIVNGAVAFLVYYGIFSAIYRLPSLVDAPF